MVPRERKRRAIWKAMGQAGWCRGRGHRAGLVRRAGWRRGGHGSAPQAPPGTLWGLRAALPRLRPGRGPSPLAGVGSRHAQGVRGGGRARVRCPEHGVVVVAVPWARHGARHTRGFDDTAAWLAVHTSMQAVSQLLRVAWETVGRVVTRVTADAEAACDRFDGLRRVGIDEISYKRGHKYLTVVVDHDAGRLVWAAPGRDAATLSRFLDASGPSAAPRSAWSAPTRRSGSR